MKITETSIFLQGMESFVPQEEKDAYRVQSGTIYIYIVPWKDNQPGRRLLLCEVNQGSVIPAFVYKDRDYKEWRFSLVAQTDAELQIMSQSVTSVLTRKFSRKAGLLNYQEEGYENSLVEFYRKEIVKDDVFIERGEKREPASKMASYGVIQDAFDDKEIHIKGKHPIYRAMAYACKFMGQEIADFDILYSSMGNQIDVMSIARTAGIICRSVVLDIEWYRKDSGVIIGNIDKETVTCIPISHNKYKIYYSSDGRVEKLSKKTAEQIEPRAYVLERTLPPHKLSGKELVIFGRKGISKSDLVGVISLGIIGVLIGILLPTLNQIIYDEYIPLGIYSELIQICVVIGTFMIGNLFFEIVKNILGFRIKSHVGYEIQDAIYYRIFHLPEKFFREYESADLAQRLTGIASAVNQFVDVIVISGISTIFSFLYFFRMFKYSAKLTWIALLLVLIYAFLLVAINYKTINYERAKNESKGKASSKLYQYLNGIEKIRMSGAEELATYEYLIPFSEEQTAEIKKNRFSAFGMVMSGIATTLFSLVFYYTIVKMELGISMGSFIAFNTALGTFSASILAMIDKLMGLYQLKPTYERLKPILETEPEDNEKSEMPGKLTGSIEVSHVSFSYREGTRMVLDDISLNIKPGEYVGIVGTSGCGKSTLLKLLLGFEQPCTGQVLYDGKNLTKMDKRAFRQNLGVVLQNGKLISGSIFENITITEPNATMKDVENVIAAVGLKEDISKMPMGIHTMLSENSNTISGGQQQRILIARAIIRHPSILIFDEATSALDNITQAAVCESLDKMNITRLVVAHRLSTIRTCDRIIVLKDGKIAEEGNYEELMKKRGVFYLLASRQIAE